MLINGTETNFNLDAISAILDTPPPEDDWRIGETIASDFLQTHHNYIFPWPGTRDARNANGSLPGADHVGFRTCDDGFVRFAFGETKTSSSPTRPPSVLTGRTGVVNQLMDRLPDRDGSMALVRYIGFKAAREHEYLTVYSQAFDRFINHDRKQAELVGVVLRTVEAHEDDLRSRCNTLAQGWRARPLDLFALYVPSQVFENLRRDWNA